MKPLIIGLIAINTMACATAPKQPCKTIDCMVAEIEQGVAKECLRHLSFHSLDRKTIAAIRAEYQYPLTNTQTYSDWLRMGNFGPSPQAWCKVYAQHKVCATSRSG